MKGWKSHNSTRTRLRGLSAQVPPAVISLKDKSGRKGQVLDAPRTLRVVGMVWRTFQETLDLVASPPVLAASLPTVCPSCHLAGPGVASAPVSPGHCDLIGVALPSLTKKPFLCTETSGRSPL